MAGMEVVVRPVVFPDIRPAPTRSLPPADDPEKGFAEIKGNGAKQIDLTNSFSSNASTSAQTEIKRRVDVARVSQKKDDGTVNKENFVDIEVANKIMTKGPPANFVGFTGDDVVPTYPGRGYTGDDIMANHYRRVEKADNIEIKERDKIRKKKSGEE